MNSYIRAVAKELPINGNTGKALSADPHDGQKSCLEVFFLQVHADIL
jgi:hypothetical protein